MCLTGKIIIRMVTCFLVINKISEVLKTSEIYWVLITEKFNSSAEAGCSKKI